MPNFVFSYFLKKCATNFVNWTVNLFNTIVCSYGPFEFGHKEHDKEEEVGFGSDVLVGYVTCC